MFASLTHFREKSQKLNIYDKEAYEGVNRKERVPFSEWVNTSKGFRANIKLLNK